MLTIYTSTWSRPDMVQLLASALRATTPVDYKFVVVVQPGGLRRAWQDVHEVVEGTVAGVQAWTSVVKMAAHGSTNVYLHDDCLPMRLWSLPPLPAGRCVGGPVLGSTWMAWEGRFRPFQARLRAPRATGETMPAWWPEDVRSLSEQGQCEVLLGGDFLHLDKSTLHHPTLSPYSAAKRPLVEAICRHLAIPCPAPLTDDELAFQRGWRPANEEQAKVVKLRNYGLGDMVAAGLAAVGVTKERVSRAIGRPCKCSQRQRALNEAGAKYLGLPPGETAIDGN